MPFAGQWELIVLAVVVVLIFGTSKLPKIGRQLGRGAREYKQTIEQIDPRASLKALEPAQPPEEQAAAKPATPAPPQPPA